MSHPAPELFPTIRSGLACGLGLFIAMNFSNAEEVGMPESGSQPEVPTPVLPQGTGDVLPPLDLPFPGELPELLLPGMPVEAAPPQEQEFELPDPSEVLPPSAVPVVEIRLREIRFEGYSIVPLHDLEALGSGLLHRPIIQEDLDEFRLRIAGLYLGKGYPNSGAVVPDQDLKHGVLTVQIIEGHLTDAIVRTFKEDAKGHRTGVSNDKASVNPSYFRNRILAGNQSPLRVQTLQNRLQILQSNPNIQRINAELKPGTLPGEAILLMEVTESRTPRWNFGLDAHNQRSPSVGGEQVECWMESSNATGFSDTLSMRLGLLTGDHGDPEFDPGQTASLRYSRAVTAHDTTLDFSAERQDYVILDEIFSPLDIEGNSWDLGMVIRHPMIRSFGSGTGPESDPSAGARETLSRTVQHDLWVGLGFDHSHSETLLLGEPFSISPGYEDGVLDLSVLRFLQDWTRRTDDSVLSVRSTVSFGINGLGSTDSQEGPDASFVSWMTAGQYSRRVGSRDDTASLRTGFQMASSSLPSPEQWILGGRYTVRGYPENSLVSDKGWFASLEYSCMLPPPSSDSKWRIAVVPFLDSGCGWNKNGEDSEFLLSCGLGLRADYDDWFRSELFWGAPLTHEELASGDDLQDDGIHFRLTLSRF